MHKADHSPAVSAPALTGREAEFAPAPLMVVHPDGVILGVNGAAEELLGRCTGKACWDMVGAIDERRQPICRPGCTGELEHAQALDRRGLARGEPIRLTCRKAGDFVVVEVRSLPEASVDCRVALSRREREILQLVAAGMSSTAIAEELELGVSTIRTYALNARKKLGAKTLAEAVAKGIRCGEIGG